MEKLLYFTDEKNPDVTKICRLKIKASENDEMLFKY